MIQLICGFFPFAWLITKEMNFSNCSNGIVNENMILVSVFRSKIVNLKFDSVLFSFIRDLPNTLPEVCHRI